MGLARYHAKRDFRVTPEPRGRVGAKRVKARAYLIQKHAASRLHYDFRLELDGVLLSWAVPKGPSLDPADKRLAMHVEDHPLEYGRFEGTIPQGQYGGGTVMLWDRGTWQPVGDAAAGYKKGHLKFDLKGEKLQGRWALIKTHGSKYGGKGEPWLLVKDTDAYARRGVDARIVEARPNSVVSGRSIDEIAAAKDREWRSDRSLKANVRAGAVAVSKSGKRKARIAASRPVHGASGAPGARRAALPAKLAPALATLVQTPPQGDDWIHEVKYDGYRMLGRLKNGVARVYSRNGKDWTDRFATLAQDIKRLRASSAWIDGELCALDAEGHSNFQALQNTLAAGSKTKLVYFAFDLVHLDGYDLSNVALVERKRLLGELLERSGTALRYSPDVRGSGADVFTQACRGGMEGVVSKRADSRYGVGLRTRNWVKVKCSLRQEMVIGGYTDPQRSRAGFGALLLGVYEAGQLRYSGKVGTGFDDATLLDIRRKLERIERSVPPFVNPPRGFEAKDVHWVEPVLVAEVRFTEWSTGGALRHPAFIGLREDKKASDVVREKPAVLPPAKSSAPTPAVRHSATPKSMQSKSDTVAGVKLSHPDKLLFPEAKLTKFALARYYEAIADWMLPHVKDRPLSLLRCPDGWNKECFYQKHAAPSVHASVTRVEVPEHDGTATYFAANSLQALVGLLQWGVVELHPWGSRMPHPERPDRLIFDFDPADDVPWPELVAAVQDLRILLETLGLTGFLKTTGGKGLHVVIPIKATLTWEQAKGFTRAVADLFAATFPQRFIATLSKAKRAGRIFVDYLRNSQGATAIAPYGIRARKNAPVATPIGWDELDQDRRFDFFNVNTIPERLGRLRHDPWQDFAATRQTLTAAMFKQVGTRTGVERSDGFTKRSDRQGRQGRQGAPPQTKIGASTSTRGML